MLAICARGGYRTGAPCLQPQNVCSLKMSAGTKSKWPAQGPATSCLRRENELLLCLLRLEVGEVRRTLTLLCGQQLALGRAHVNLVLDLDVGVALGTARLDPHHFA